MSTRLRKGVGGAVKARLRASLAPIRLPITAPWDGYQPDPNVDLLNITSADIVNGLVVRSGKVTGDYGWRRLGPDSLPLGHTTATTGYTDSAANTYGSGSGGSATTVQPVVCQDRYVRIGNSGITSVNSLAITADTGGASGANQETGHLFSIGSTSDVWTSKEFRSSDGDVAAEAPVPGDLPLTGTVTDLPDATTYARGMIGYLGTTNEVYTVAESVYVFTNDNDEVMYYPDRTGSSNYTSFKSIATQWAGVATEVGAGSVNPSFTSLKARSVTTAFERALYLNVEMDGERFTDMVLWSRIGSPAIVWPSLLVDTSPFPNGVGAGSTRFDEFGGLGLRIEPIGNNVACYFQDGVGLLLRNNNVLAPFTRRYVTHQRGLMGTHALVDLGGGVHFGIFTDGWYLFSANGSWQEVGRIGTNDELTQRLQLDARSFTAYKWKETFYNNINQDHQASVYLHYDTNQRLIRIAWPSGSSNENNETWLYDLQNDRVTTDDYGAVGSSAHYVRCWGSTDTGIDTVTTWADHAGKTWFGENGEGSWADLAISYGVFGTTHSTDAGLVFLHDAKLALRDGEKISWEIRMRPNGFGDPTAMKTMDRIFCLFENNSNQIESCTIAVEAIDGDGNSYEESTSLDLSLGTSGRRAVSEAGFRVTGALHAVTLRGIGTPILHSLLAQLLPVGRPTPEVTRGQSLGARA